MNIRAFATLFVLLFASSVQASPLFDSHLAKALFRTPEGETVMRRILGLSSSSTPNYRQFIRRIQEPRFESVRGELERRIRETSTLLEEYRAFRSTEPGEIVPTSKEASALKANGPLTSDEVRLLAHLAPGKFRLNPEWVASRSGRGAGEIEFLPSRNHSPYEATRNRFFLDEPLDPSMDLSPTTKSASAFKREIDRVSGFFSKMSRCLKTQAPKEAKRDRVRYFLISLGLGEFMTVGGYIVGTGWDRVEIKDLSADMLMSFLSSTVSSFLLTRRTTVTRRWIRMLIYGQGRSMVDATYYYFTPVKDTNGVSDADAAMDRFTYNSSWNLTTTQFSVGLYQLIAGLECLYPNSKMVALSTGMRFLYSTGSTLAYFTLRQKYFDRQLERAGLKP